MSKTTLDSIGLKFGTDKASSHHNYLNFYEPFFAPIREEPLSILEIGVLGGASLRTWEAYFPDAKIIGADIVVSSKQYQRGRVSIELIDQSNVEELTHLCVSRGPFDIVIEDGSHMWEHQITSLRTIFPFVKNNGLYIVEDLQTNFGTMVDRYKGIATVSCVHFLKIWLDYLVGDDQIQIDQVEDAFLRTYGRSVEFITFYRRACLIRKRSPIVNREINAGEPLSPMNGSRIRVSVLAHISHVGDVWGTSGYVNMGDEKFTLQGLSITSGEASLEYRVRWPDKSWSEWSQDGGFVGTRGQFKALTGVTVRLRADTNRRLSLCTLGRFVGSPNPVKVSDGQECISPESQMLCGIQIDMKMI